MCIKLLPECAAGAHTAKSAPPGVLSSTNKTFLSLAASCLHVVLWLVLSLLSPQPWPVQVVLMLYAVQISPLLDPTSCHCLL